MHIHVVKRGDTLSSIAAMHDALPAFVAADNGLTLSTPLVIGQALVVRTPKTLHTVRAGETLSSIARDYDLSVRTLLRRNFFLHGRELLRDGAEQVSGRLVDLGIEGFWNFSHYDLSVSYPEVVVENVHLGDSLMSLGYRLRNQD